MPKNSALPKNFILKEKRVNDSFTDLASHFAQIFSERLRGLIVLFFLLSGSLAGQQITPGNPQPVTSSLTNSRPRLSRDATQVPDVIGIAPLFDRLKDLPVDHPTADGASTNLEALLLRQEITEKVLAASLDVDSVNAIIDSEIEQIRATRSDLQSRRDKAQNIINVASIVTGGALGVVNTALQFNERTANLGNGIGVVGGAASVVLSVVGIHKQSGGRRDLRECWPDSLAARPTHRKGL